MGDGAEGGRCNWVVMGFGAGVGAMVMVLDSGSGEGGYDIVEGRDVGDKDLNGGELVGLGGGGGGC